MSNDNTLHAINEHRQIGKIVQGDTMLHTIAEHFLIHEAEYKHGKVYKRFPYEVSDGEPKGFTYTRHTFTDTRHVSIKVKRRDGTVDNYQAEKYSVLIDDSLLIVHIIGRLSLNVMLDYDRCQVSLTTRQIILSDGTVSVTIC